MKRSGLCTGGAAVHVEWRNTIGAKSLKDPADSLEPKSGRSNWPARAKQI